MWEKVAMKDSSPNPGGTDVVSESELSDSNHSSINGLEIETR